MNTDDIIRRMRQVYAVKNDSELAHVLGLTVSAPSNWRQRNSPPLAICVDVAHQKNVSLDWLIFGVERASPKQSASSISDEKQTSDAQSPTVKHISQFLQWWHATRTSDEMVWLDQQFKRAVPEYKEWLASQE